MNVNSIKKKILKYDVISFDIFDTLIKRNCNNPIDIFKVVEKRYNNKYNDNLNFYYIRAKSEDEAKKRTGKIAVTLDDIYENMPLNRKKCLILKKIEIETELDYCTSNKLIREVYNFCKAHNKKIICISDMYLKNEILAQILQKNGYDINDIYVSCEFNKIKRNGGLFNAVINNLNINKDKILHIGDNLKADVLGAIISKIHFIKISNQLNNTNFFKTKSKELNFSEKILFSVINNNVDKEYSYYKSFGYEIFGPVCLSFINWIHNEIMKSGCNNILFCARDMKLIYEMYNYVYNSDKDIDTHYFYVSRKSSYLPYLYKNNSLIDFAKILPKDCREIRIDELLDIYNIKIDQIEKRLNQYHIKNKKYNVQKLIKMDSFISFYNSEIKNEIESIGKEQYNFFMSYLKKIGVNDKKTAIVDLGWHGTTQNIVNEIIKNKTIGLYFGLINDKDEIDKKAFLCQNKDDFNYKRLYPSLVLNELLFSALHGTTIYYSNDKDEPYILGPSANSKNLTILEIQDGVREFISDIKSFIKDLDDCPANTFIDKFFNMGLKPSIFDANCIGEIYEEKKDIIKLAAPKSLNYYLLHFKHFKEDFLDSKWKIGFLKRLFKIPLPYYKIYHLILKKKGK